MTTATKNVKADILKAVEQQYGYLSQNIRILSAIDGRQDFLGEEDKNHLRSLVIQDQTGVINALGTNLNQLKKLEN